MSLVLATAVAAAAPAAPTALGASGGVATGGSLMGMLFGLFVVVGLILVLGWVLRRLPGSGQQARGRLKLVASLPLGARERVVVVDVNGEQMVLGVTGQQVSLIKALDTPLPATESNTPNFAALLAQRLGGGK
ncbi:MAG: flagellar biosynthetic protein FliO [Lysobacteraceae bacterium]